MPRAGNKSVFNSITHSSKASSFYALGNLFPSRTRTHVHTHTHTHTNNKKKITKTYTFPCCMSQNPHPTLTGFTTKTYVSGDIRQLTECQRRPESWSSILAGPHADRVPWSKAQASQVALVVKNPPANAGDIRDTSSIPGSGRSPGGGHSNLLQYSCLANPMDRAAWWATVLGVSKSPI